MRNAGFEMGDTGFGKQNSSHGPLTVFSTEPVKRRVEHNTVLQAGVLDASRLFTQKKLLELCEQTARRAELLNGRTPGTAEKLLLLEQAVGDLSFAPGQPLARLSSTARAGLLEQLINQFAFLAEHETTLIQWLLAHDPQHKLHGFGLLLDAWRLLCAKAGIADRFSVNRALLQLIETGELPPQLNGGIQFRAVRWFNPFEERFVAALKTRLGEDLVQIFSVLPAAHAEAAGDRLCATVRARLGDEEEWKAWAEDFADACEADDSNILENNSRERVSFFVSAHPYGEIEDAARRIAAEIENGTAPDQIALIVRDVGPYTDIIPDVFQRFGIPYHFRRGTPASARPAVKALLALLDLSSGFSSGESRRGISRDRLCDLLLMPGVDWPGVDDREELVAQIRKTQPPQIRRLPKELRCFFTNAGFLEQSQSIIQQHRLRLPEEVLNLIEEFKRLNLPALPEERIIALLENVLDNTTIKDPADIESGVWIVNPMDAAGLRFESVFIAGMDARTFPRIPKTDALLNSAQRKALRSFLEERKIPCPRLALSETGEALIQEEILFLTALSCATEKLFLSYTRADANGKERSPGEFYERMRGIAECTEPERGESFHTILPPDAVRAEDEARQTEAWQTRNADAMSSSRSGGSRSVATGSDRAEPSTTEGVVTTIQKWLTDHPEFSATALESLARSRYVFFLEKMLVIKPDRLHADDTDPMDRGTIVHDILEQVYAAIAEQSDLYAVPAAGAAGSLPSEAFGEGRVPPAAWKLTQQQTEAAIPLAVFSPERTAELVALAREIAEAEFAKAERRPSRHLGHPAVWETEKRKLHQVIENFVRMDCATAQSEQRYPARFELKFDAKHDLPVVLRNPTCRAGMVEDLPAMAGREARSAEGDPTPSVVPALQNEEIRLKGKIDRVDLIFDNDGELRNLLVVDYKSKNRTDTAETIAKKTALNLDCQLALYTFAAQQFFFGTHNTPELNEKVQAVYHLQERDLQKMAKHFHNEKKRLTMTPELTQEFLETLFSNVRKLRSGDLATEPLIAGYDDYSHICRTTASDPEELLKQTAN